MALKIGQLLELPFTNHAIPVDLILNGNRGSYMLTEQVELSSTRVNIDKKEGILLEIDTNFDEDFQFKSTHYKLPVMVKDPDIESEEHFQRVKDEFHQLEAAIASDQFPNTPYKEYLDVDSLAKYFIVYNLTHNMEINHPKSTTYIRMQGKYTMDPFGISTGPMISREGIHFGSFSDRSNQQELPCTRAWVYLLQLFFEDPEFVALYKETWSHFIQKKDELMEYSIGMPKHHGIAKGPGKWKKEPPTS